MEPAGPPPRGIGGVRGYARAERMPFDEDRWLALQAELSDLHDRGVLTKDRFLELAIEIERALGDGPESEGIEAALNLAKEPSWVDAFEAAPRA